MQLVNLRVADLPDALRSGAVDVAVLIEPHVTRLAKQIGASTVRDPQERKLLPTTSYFYARPQVLADANKSAAIGQFQAQVGAWRLRHVLLRQQAGELPGFQGVGRVGREGGEHPVLDERDVALPPGEAVEDALEVRSEGDQPAGGVPASLRCVGRAHASSVR